MRSIAVGRPRSFRIARGWLITTLAILGWCVLAIIGLGLWPLIVWMQSL